MITRATENLPWMLLGLLPDYLFIDSLLYYEHEEKVVGPNLEESYTLQPLHGFLGSSNCDYSAVICKSEIIVKFQTSS